MKVSKEMLKAVKGEKPLPFYFFALWPLSMAYGLAVRARAAFYGAGILRTRTLPCKVVSVGNLTSGGTGKTPMVVHLAKRLVSGGRKTAVLTRGYKGALEGRTAVVSDEKGVVLAPEHAGDEAVLLARSLNGVPVVMGSDRYEAGAMALERFGPEVMILDDGYQHMGLKRDLNVLLMDAARPFGNGFTLPMGYLREPKTAMKRADIIILTRAGEETASKEIQALAGGIPVAKAAHRPKVLSGLWDGARERLETLAGARVLAVSGLADPASFALILKQLNAKITRSVVYPDHYGYRQEDITDIEAAAAETGAGVVVTTEKDAVKLGRLVPGRLRFLVLGIEMGFVEGEEALEALLRERLGLSA